MSQRRQITLKKPFFDIIERVSSTLNPMVKIFKKISRNQATWKILQKNGTECVHVYLNTDDRMNNKLVLFNHAGNGGFGGVGHRPLSHDQQIDKLANFLRKTADNQSVIISEIQIIGCHCSEQLAQSIANKSGFTVKTLKSFYSVYDQAIYGMGHSRIAFNSALDSFVYGFVFDNPQEFINHNVLAPFHWVHGDNFDRLIPQAQIQPVQLFVHNMERWRPVDKLCDYFEDDKNYSVYQPTFQLINEVQAIDSE